MLSVTKPQPEVFRFQIPPQLLPPPQLRLAPARRWNWRRLHVIWYGRSRWRYVHLGSHPFRTPRRDGRTAFWWLAMGPIDVRWAR